MRAWRVWTWSHRVTAALFLALLVVGSSPDLAFVRGSTTATSYFSLIPFTDPLAALESVLAGGQLTTDMVLGVGLLLAVTLALGPVFCGWLCPLGLVLDLNQELRRLGQRLLRGKRSPPPATVSGPGLPRGLKFMVLGSLLGVAMVGRLPVFSAVSPIHTITRAAVFGADVALLSVWLLMVVEWFLPRTWCRSLCPLGALYSVIGRRSLLALRIDPHRAGQSRCQRCEVACPMGIAVMTDFTLRSASRVDHPDCNRCGTCLDACPRSVLRLGFGHTDMAHDSLDKTKPPGGVTINGEQSSGEASLQAPARSRAPAP